MKSHQKPKRVFVGLSGGVDSSVSVALLKREGYDVTGVFIKTWHPDFLPCTWKDDRLDAMRVAAHLGIPFLTLDAEEEYRRDVAEYMIREYESGRTPNPDVMCNKHIKFGIFLERALEMGADFIATGHYARVVAQQPVGKFEIRTSKTKTEGEKKYDLLAGIDKEKDQSYFLWTLGQKELQHVLFPVGGYQKREVRKLAEKFELPTAKKKDSQGICFLGDVDMREFLSHYMDSSPGNVLDENGEVIGVHDGVVFYTLGQRHGFTVTKRGTNDRVLYVVRKNKENNTLTVSSDAMKKSDENSTQGGALLESTNWIGEAPKQGETYFARYRYRGKLHPCRIEQKGESFCAYFDDPAHLWSSGQSLVLYDDDTCLGGGILV